jgi:hypothetical protein
MRDRPLSNKQKKVTVLLEEAEFEDFDRFCRENGFKKSTLLARLLREFLSRARGARDGPGAK